MRHSVITLAMDTYGHLFPGQEAETVARLPDLKRPAARGGHGNRNLRPKAPAGTPCAGAMGEKRRSEARRGETPSCDVGKQDDGSHFPNLLPVPPLGEPWQEAATIVSSGRDGTRTHTPGYGDGILNLDLPIFASHCCQVVCDSYFFRCLTL